MHSEAPVEILDALNSKGLRQDLHRSSIASEEILDALNSKGLRPTITMTRTIALRNTGCPELKGIKTSPLATAALITAEILDALNSKGLRQLVFSGLQVCH